MASNKNSLALISLGKIRTDGDTQSRANSTLDQSVIEDYAEDLARGCSFPPIVVYHDRLTGDYWLASGFHRLAAYRLAGRSAIEAEVVPGTREAARLFAAGSNASHGLRRSRQDKRRSVLMCLEDKEGRHWSADRIARHCGVSDSFARAMKLAFDPTEGGTEFERPMGLFGPDELAKIPSPASCQRQRESAAAVVVAAEEGTDSFPPDERLHHHDDDHDEEEVSPGSLDAASSDRGKNFERARRTWRKLMRFADLLGFPSLVELTQELQRREDAAHEAEMQKERLAREMERAAKRSQQESQEPASRAAAEEEDQSPNRLQGGTEGGISPR